MVNSMVNSSSRTQHSEVCYSYDSTCHPSTGHYQVTSCLLLASQIVSSKTTRTLLSCLNSNAKNCAWQMVAANKLVKWRPVVRQNGCSSPCSCHAPTSPSTLVVLLPGRPFPFRGFSSGTGFPRKASLRWGYMLLLCTAREPYVQLSCNTCHIHQNDRSVHLSTPTVIGARLPVCESQLCDLGQLIFLSLSWPLKWE